MKRLAGIQFKRASKIYLFECADIEPLKQCNRVIVETEFGLGLGRVVLAPHDVEDDKAPPELKRIVRLANESDYEREKKNIDREKNAFEMCHKLIQTKNLGMKLIRVEYFFDASKAIFYFSAEQRVDFRELVRDLARVLHTRIEMKQIGVRDETKILGGIGCCGQICCCTMFLREFSPVSVKMAKEQNLAMNPTKISGLCGRLMCCLAYEHNAYEDLGKDLPRKGKTVETADGPMKVTDVNVLKRLVTLTNDDGTTVTVPVNKIQKTLPQSSAAEYEDDDASDDAGGPDDADEESGSDEFDLPMPEVTPLQNNEKPNNADRSKSRRRGKRRKRKPRGAPGENSNL